MNQILDASAMFFFVKDIVNEKFFFIINYNWRRLGELLLREEYVVIFDEGNYLQEMKSREDVWLVWQFKGHSGVNVINSRDVIRAIVMRHELGNVILAFPFVVVTSV